MARDEVIALPRYCVALKFIEIPSVDLSEIKNMIEYQALKEFPFAREEMIISFRNIGSYKKGFSYIMLVVAKKQDIKEIISRKKELPGSIRLETEILYLYFLKQLMVQQDKVNLIINIRKDYSEIMVINGIQPVYSRGFEAMDTQILLKEIRRSIISYEADRNNKSPETASIINNSGLFVDNIKSSLEEFLSIPACFSGNRRGAADLDMPLEIELLPGEYINKKAKIEVIKRISLTGLLFLITVFVLIFFFIFRSQHPSPRLHFLQ